MYSKAPQDERERRLLTEIGGLSDRIRALRGTGASNGTQIRALEAQSRAKWEELRLLRAGSVNLDLPAPNLGGLYR